ncbi:HlyD family efflux transporter periplasmic adaptor subunit [Aquabacterium soli]|uniref:HlyD family efflux transporter periplasmic adaptor subunit n=1 Tax=Aquabacterium soli TaxID=2493092 RepID=A0A3R8S661_9BURK|nr:HlyD family efflux transporter periplasmic adaptor subunit [Aquabacterium soli]RRS02472.1 HlyD family efflux transporter periplasmic adaptor subunit [Aquabacterium soli]
MSSDDPQSLFRQEVLSARADTASGASVDIRPVGAGRLTAFFVLLALMVLGVLVFGSYTKKERVQGVVQAREGVAMVVPPEAGTIKRVLVSEGDAVKAGDVIAEIGSERYTDAGSTQALLEKNLQGQREQVAAQTEAQAQAHTASLASLEQRIAQARRDLVTGSEEIRLQQQQIASSTKLLDQLKPLLADRIISELQYEQQHQTLLDQTGRLQTLKRQRSATEAELAQAQDERNRLRAQHRLDRATLDRDLLNLQQEQVQRRGTSITLLKAPVDGVVSGLLATPGQSVAAGTVLASVVPSSAKLEAVLYVPSTAMGFIKTGQGVRISYDAFPYQRFGQYHGTVRAVSQTDVTSSAPASTGGQQGQQDRRAVFMVRVALAQPSVRAYDTDIALRPGHTLTADIEIDRRRLIRWMLDPLFAFSGKL